MKCLECGREVRNINFRHLKSCSGLTPQEYRAKHPGAELIDPDVRKSCGLPLEKNPKWQGGRSYRYCKFCGKRLSRHTQSGHCRKCVSKGEKNPFFGRKHSDETRERMVSSARHRDRATYFPTKPSSESLSQGRRKYWSSISQSERASRLELFIAAGQRHNKKASRTKIEDIIAEVLSEMGLSFKRNLQVGRYNVDFLVQEQVIIECFGDYWHCNPKIYSPDFYHRSLYISAKEKWRRDKERRNWLEEQDYIFHFFWEYDIKHYLDRIRQKLRELFDIDLNSERREG